MEKRLHIPHTITEFDDNMLVPLSGNFGKIQKHIARAEADIESLATNFEIYVNETNTALTEINQTLQEILDELSTETTT